MRKALFTALVAGVVLVTSASLAGAAGAGGVTGPSFYVDGTFYRTVGTPTDLSGTGAPVVASTRSTSSSACSRTTWRRPPRVTPATTAAAGGSTVSRSPNYAAAVAAFDANGSGDFDGEEEVEAALAAGAATDIGIVKSFVCPVIKIH